MGRKILSFNDGWLYSPKDYQKGELKNFDESDFEQVTLPHANAVLNKHTAPGSEFLAQIELYRFVSWYRRHFVFGKEYEGKRFLIEFEGVATACEVYVNEQFAGEHKGAYTTFCFDITKYITLGEENVLAVRVDSTKRCDIPPEGHEVDYCIFGGIVRNVNLKIVNDIYIDNIFVTSPYIADGDSRLRIKTQIKNLTGQTKCELEVSVFDNDGNMVLKNVGGTDFFTDKIDKPNLWSVENPYLYTVKASLLCDGKETDDIEVRFGMRYFEFKSEKEDGCFYLNGEKLKLRGVNRHEQWPWQGRAVPNKLQIRDADMIKESGLNAVRCSHYPQSPAFLDRCDEIGLIVFEEAPGWQHIGGEAWQAIYKYNIEEMILRDRNHPSIVTWGVRVNESNDNDDLYRTTNAISKGLDPTRPTHGVRREDTYHTTSFIEDILCANYIYPEAPRTTPFLNSEHSWTYWSKGNGMPGASDGDAMLYTKDYADVVDYYYGNDLCAGGFAWCMFDYNNEVNYTKTGHIFYSGLYDIFRLDKPVSHFYKSQKDIKEGVEIYIANYWTENSPSSVEIYSNCDEAELFVNGKSKGKIKPNLYLNTPHPSFCFENIDFEKGELKAVGYIAGEKAGEFIRLTPETADRIVLTPDYNNLVADGTDMTQVTVEMVDINGTRLPYCDSVVNIEIEGAGEFIGEEQIALEGGRCIFLVKSKYMVEGKIRCEVSCNNVKPGHCVINVQKYDPKDIVPVK